MNRLCQIRAAHLHLDAVLNARLVHTHLHQPAPHRIIVRVYSRHTSIKRDETHFEKPVPPRTVTVCSQTEHMCMADTPSTVHTHLHQPARKVDARRYKAC